MPRNGTTTATLSRDSRHPHSLLSNSISSLADSTSSRPSSSQISKIYRQASTLFLTRRLPESLSTILPVIVPDEDDGQAPIASSSRTTRIKVWSLYLTILNAVVELEPEEGKQAFGSRDWRELCTKVREGQVWEEVVRDGYGGVEGEVDSDVVINLATLLLAHARTQHLNQQRLETYLAASTTPTLDLNSRLLAAKDPRDALRRSNSTRSKSGTDTPRDLNARIKILELYTLHVLLRNNEWAYSREFITNSEVLDDERREAFLQALQSLQDEQAEQDTREAEAQRRHEEQLQRDVEEDRRQRIAQEQRERERQAELEQAQRAAKSSSSRKGDSEVDYGIDDSSSHHTHPPTSNTKRQSSPSKNAAPKSKSSLSKQTPKKSKALDKKKSPTTIISRTSAIFAQLHNILREISLSWSRNPMVLLRMLAFIVAIVTILGRKDLRERIRAVLARGWGKVRATAGMGVKVSYI